eukprot:660722-Amphidinium_carterae.1
MESQNWRFLPQSRPPSRVFHHPSRLQNWILCQNAPVRDLNPESPAPGGGALSIRRSRPLEPFWPKTHIAKTGFENQPALEEKADC